MSKEVNIIDIELMDAIESINNLRERVIFDEKEVCELQDASVIVLNAYYTMEDRIAELEKTLIDDNFKYSQKINNLEEILKNSIYTRCSQNHSEKSIVIAERKLLNERDQELLNILKEL